MKGIILAAGAGTRLKPMTLGTNKMLLPLYDKPMIIYSIELLKKSGIKEILIIIGRDNFEGLIKMLGDGSEFGVEITYRVQQERLGIVHALNEGKQFVGKDKFALTFGDNFFSDTFEKTFKDFEKSNLESMIFVKKVSDPERFGVIEIENNKIKSIEEKPKRPKSDLAVTGLYLFSPKIFEYVPLVKKSARGEYEIPDLLSIILSKGKMNFDRVNGYWNDLGTIDALHETTKFIVKNNESRK